MNCEDRSSGPTVPFVLGVLVGLAFTAALFGADRLSHPPAFFQLGDGAVARCTLFAEARR